MNSVFIIAEVGQAHDGSLGMVHSYIDRASEIGVDAIKFQTHIATAESSPHEEFRVKFSYQDKTRMDYWKRMEFTPEQWVGIKNHCNKCGVEFMSSVFSIEALELIEKIGVKRHKIASGEVKNFLLLDKIIQTQKPIILSSGMSSLNDIDIAIERINKTHNDFSLMQCTSQYPTAPEEIGLNVFEDFKKRYNCKIGLSDHSGRIEPGLAAIALGAKIYEGHITFSKDMFGPDSKSSLEIDEFKNLVQGIRYLEKALDSKIVKEDTDYNLKMKNIFGKSLAVRRDLAVGERINLNDLETKKPAGLGMSPEYYESLIGKKLKKAMNKYDFINKEDIENG